MTVYLDFQDAQGWRNISQFVKDDYNITDRAMSSDYKRASNLFSFNIIYDSIIFGLIRNTTKTVLVQALEGSVIFAGYFKPNTSMTYNGIINIQTLSIEAQDFMELLNVSVGTEADSDIAFENYKICDPADTSHSLVHALFTAAGLSFSLIDASITIPTVVAAVTSNSPDDKIIDILDVLLHEYGYVANWNSAGLFAPKVWIPAEDSLPTYTFNDTNICDTITEATENSEFEGTEVTWYGLDTKNGTRVYTESLPFAEDGAFDGYAVLSTFRYPPESNVIDDTTGTYQNVYQEYTDEGIRYKTSKYVQDEYVMDFALAHADFSEIIITKNHAIEERFEAGLTRDVTIFRNKRCRIRYYNPNVTSRLLYYMNVSADVVFKRSQQKCRILPVGGTNKINKYESRFLFDKTNADRLCKAYQSKTIRGKYKYSFSSKVRVEDGTFVSLVISNGLTASGHIMERAFDGMTGIYSYEVRGFSSDYVAVTSRSVVVASISGDDATSIAIGKPSMPSASVAGDNIFRYYEGHTTPTNLYLEQKLSMSDSTYVVTSYQWYYRNIGGIDTIIVGETTATLRVDYNETWLLAKDTTVTCVVNGKYAYSASIIKTYDPNNYELRISSPVVSISYDKNGTTPAPSGQASYVANFYENNVLLSTGVTYSWTVGACLSVASGATSKTLVTNIATTRVVGDTFVNCTATWSENRRTLRMPVGVAYYDKTLGWNMEWDSTKDTMYSGDVLIGNTVVTARIYSGTLESDPSHPGFKRLANGIAIGENMQVCGPAGTQEISGLVIVKSAVVTAYMDTDGNAHWNGTLGANVVKANNIEAGAISADKMNIGPNMLFDTDEVTAYNGQGVNRRAVRIKNESLDWIDAPNGIDGQLRARIGRLGVGASILMDGEFNAQITASWGAESIINATSSYEPTCIQLQNGELRVAYRRVPDYYLVERVWNGTAWGAESIINAAVSYYPSYIQLQNGELRVAYRRGSDYYLVERVWNGTAWGAESIINATSSYEPTCIQLQNGELRVAYRRDPDYYLVERVWNGTAWGAESIINAAVSYYPSYMQLQTGELRVAYARGSDYYLVERVWNGTAWGAESIINAAVSYYPSYIQLQTGELRVVYARGSDYYLVDRVWNGTAWGAESIINATSSYEPTCIQLQNGELRVAYRRVSEGYIVERTLQRYAQVGAGIIESGPNYRKFSDGSMDVYWYVTPQPVGVNNLGFPAGLTFIDTNYYISGSVYPNGAHAYFEAWVATTSTFNLYSQHALNSYYVKITGRWRT